MRVWAIWHGGASYSPSSVPRDVERFSSLASARYALEERYRNGDRYTQEFAYVNRETERVLVPAVSEDSELWIFFSDPSDSSDPYPDRIIRLTRYGRSTVEHA